MSEWVGVAGALLSFATPLLIASAGETVLEKSGILNIGLEGMMLTSAYAAFFTSHLTGSPWLGIAGGVAAAVAIALLSSLFVIRLAADQVVVGTAINLLALGVTGSLFVASFGRTGQLVSVEAVPKLGGQLALNPVMMFAIVAPILFSLLISRTRWGLAARACGESPEAVDALGFSPQRIRFQASLIAAVAAGIAGSYLTVAQTNSFAPNMTVGIGFVVIAAVTFGRWTMIGTVAASLVIASGYAVQFLLKATNPNIPYQLFDALPYLLALIVLIGAGRSSSAPAQLALPYKPK